MNKRSIKRLFGIVVMTFFSVSIFITCKTVNNRQAERLFNEEWIFIRDSLTGVESPGYDDSGWMVVDLPHDYSMMDLPGEDGPGQIGPFSKKSPGGGRSNGQVLGGTGWYRKHFTIDKADAGKTVVIKFDGVYMETEVWVNGKPAGVHKYGYSPFWFDITALLNPAGVSNVIAVKVDNTGRNTRWYTGSGIYRNVHLTITDPVHTAVWGVYIKTPEIKENSAIIDAEITTQNDGNKVVEPVIKIKIKDPAGKTVNEIEATGKIEAHGKSIISKQVPVSNPALWSPDEPKMYQAEITVSVDNKTVDQYIQSFGIRSIEYSAEKGFLLNGKSIKLKGGSIHHDNGLLGSAAFDRAEERRVEILKANGYNAIRCSHNPPSEAFLNACDRLGMLVIDEFTDIWETPKNPHDYSRFFKEWWKKDLTDMILRDRNHPSIIMWSIGNEILEKNDTSGLRIGKQLVDAVKELDNTRPVTEAINDNWRKRGKEWDNTAAAFALLDIGGYNYEWKWMESDHEKYPNRVMYGSESFPLEAYDYWMPVEKHNYVIGDFVWTAMDYLGEVGLGISRYVSNDEQRGTSMNMASPATATPGVLTPDMAVMMALRNNTWPAFGAYCGDIDITGEKKPQKAYRDVLWNISNIEMNVHTPIPDGKTERIARWGWPDEWPSWNWKGNEGKPLQVRVFTKASYVRLELNGKVIGEKNLSSNDKYIAVFEVPYQPGELKAIAMNNEKVIATKIVKTSGEVTGIRLVTDRNTINADRNDLSFVTIEAIDANGAIVPDAAVKVRLTLSGNGELAASGNGSPDDMESVNKPVVKTFKGKAQAIIRPFAKEGSVILKAESEGLPDSELKIYVSK